MPKELTSEEIEHRKELERLRQRRAYEKRVAREHGKPFHEIERRRGPVPSGAMRTYNQRRALAHRKAYELHKTECRKIDCSICSITFSQKEYEAKLAAQTAGEASLQQSTVLDAVLDAPTSIDALKNI